ncbi:MAG: hypothetical protein PHW04_09040 [Candidatus Wallbacteria bacterium]|nr:hypothetical protein [Candidatus Wallbacteria bacterium]
MLKFYDYILLAFLFLMITYTGVYYSFARSFTRELDPGLYARPQVRMPAESSQGTFEVKLKDLNFKAPWSGGRLSPGEENVISYEFQDGIQIMLVTDPSLNYRDQQDWIVVSRVLKEFPDEKSFNCNFTQAYLSATPAEIHYLEFPWTLYYQIYLLIFKQTANQGVSGDIYSITRNNLKIFQIGSTGTTGIVILDIFDDKDRFYQILITGKTVKQEEIDSMIISLKIIP